MSWGKLMTDWLDGQCQWWGVGVRNKRSTGCKLECLLVLVLLVLVVVWQVLYFANFTRRPLRSPVCGLWGQLVQGGLDRGHCPVCNSKGCFICRDLSTSRLGGWSTLPQKWRHTHSLSNPHSKFYFRKAPTENKIITILDVKKGK